MTADTTTVHPTAPAQAGAITRWALEGAATLASGLLLADALGLHPDWWAGWLAPAPVLAAAVRGAAPWRARALGTIAGLVPALTTLTYYAVTTGWPIAVLLIVARAVFWGGAIGFAASAARRLPAGVAVFALPAFATGAEVLLLAFSPHGSYGSYAYSQMDLPPVIQLAALGGVPAITFVTLSGASLLGLLGARLAGARLGVRGLAVATAAVAAIVGGALGFGAHRLSHADAGPQVDVSLVSSGRIRSPAHGWSRVMDAYGPALRAEARPGAVVVLPEGLAVLDQAAAQAAAAQVTALSRGTGATFLIGMDVKEGPHRVFNRALLATPDGRALWYTKQHLVPGLETSWLTPGHALLVSQAAGVRAGVAICKDMHFPGLGRDYGAAGAQLMLVPAWDFVRDGWMADRLSLLRGVEGGYGMARAARDGISSLSDRYGRVLAEGESRPDGVTVVRGRVALAPAGATTLYDRIGDAFGWACLVLAVGLGVAARVVRRTPSAA